MDSLQKELLDMVIEVCKITDPVPDDFSADNPLIGPDSPLGIDSLDAVEIVFTLQKRYNVRIDSEETSREVLSSLTALTDFIRKKRQEST